MQTAQNHGLYVGIAFLPKRTMKYIIKGFTIIALAFYVQMNYNALEGS